MSTLPNLGMLNGRLSLAKLEFFCLVVQLGSGKRAAEALNLPQSIVNARLRSLERQCDVVLFVPGEPSLRLTEEGQRVYEWAAETLARGRSLVRELQSLEKCGQQGAVLVAASLSIGTYLLPSILAGFLERRPAVRVTVTTASSEAALRDVRRGDADFSIAAMDAPPDDPALLAVLLGEEDLVLVAPNDGAPFTDAIPLAGLGDLPLIGPPSGSSRRDVLENLIAAQGASVRKSYLGLEHPEGAKQAVIANLGVTLVSRSTVAEELEQGLLREVRFTDAVLAYNIYAVKRADKRLSVVQQELFALICDAVQRRFG